MSSSPTVIAYLKIPATPATGNKDLNIGLEMADLADIFAQLTAEDLFVAVSNHPSTMLIGVKDAMVAENPDNPAGTRRKCPFVLGCSKKLDRRIGKSLISTMDKSFGEKPHADPTGNHIVFVISPDSIKSKPASSS